MRLYLDIKVEALQNCISPGNLAPDKELQKQKIVFSTEETLLILTHRIPHVQLDKRIMLCLVCDDDSCLFALTANKKMTAKRNSKTFPLIYFGKDYSFNTLFLFL